MNWFKRLFGNEKNKQEKKDTSANSDQKPKSNTDLIKDNEKSNIQVNKKSKGVDVQPLKNSDSHKPFGDSNPGQLEAGIVASLISNEIIDPMVLLEQLSSSLKFSFSRDLSPDFDLRWIHQNPLQITPEKLKTLALETWSNLDDRDDLEIDINDFFNPVTREGLILLVRQKRKKKMIKSNYKPGFFPTVLNVNFWGDVESNEADEKFDSFKSLIDKLNPAVQYSRRLKRFGVEDDSIKYAQEIEFYDESEATSFFNEVEKWLKENTSNYNFFSPYKCPKCKCYCVNPIISGVPCWHCGHEPKAEY